MSWTDAYHQSVPRFLAALADPARPGRYRPSLHGVTELGAQISLGFSCLALKTRYALGLWEHTERNEREAWLDFIRSFQSSTGPAATGIRREAFVDGPAIAYLQRRRRSWRECLTRRRRGSALDHADRAVLAETKQAIATLAQVGTRPLRPYCGLQLQAEALTRFLEELNWRQPWGAGGQAAVAAVVTVTEAPELVGESRAAELQDVCSRFYRSVLDEPSGAYFRGRRPRRHQLVNGAMKVLRGLDWLGQPVHCPERLIDTCLEALPDPDGCALVDAVYVLYRCLRETDHRRAGARDHCRQALRRIGRHAHTDGGFSYRARSSQRTYYGIPITEGWAVSDVHGTCLLTWALSMIAEILDENPHNWQVIRP